MQRKRKQYSIEDQLRALRLGDDNGFTIVLNNNIKGAEFMARTLTGRRNLSIVEAHTQHTVRNPFGHSVVFDIFARDSSGDLICIDIQKVFSGWKDASRRMLQYASMLNLHALEKGSKYGMAKEVFVVFIFDTDILKKGKALYEYRMRMEDGTELMDANMTIIVANGAYRDTIESDISKLFSDLQESDPGKMKVPVLREAMERLKGRDSEMMSEYDRMMNSIKKDIREEGMAIGLEEGKTIGLQEGKTIGLQEGKAIGLEEGKAAVARKMIKASMPFETIADLTDLTLEDIRMIASKMT